jgi:hypothetical protein
MLATGEPFGSLCGALGGFIGGFYAAELAYPAGGEENETRKRPDPM